MDIIIDLRSEISTTNNEYSEMLFSLEKRLYAMAIKEKERHKPVYMRKRKSTPNATAHSHRR